MIRKVLLFVLTMMFSANIAIFAQKDAISILTSDYKYIMDTAKYGERLKAQKADYIIAIDVSGTMLQHKNIVVPALRSFLASIPDGDYVSFIKFGTKAIEYGMSGKINPDTRSSFYDYPEQIYAPDREFSGSTDLCQMSAKIVEFMNRPEANNLKYIFMFTDFIHEPQVATGMKQWDELGNKVGGLYSSNTIRAFAMKLPGQSAGRDIGLIKSKLFPNLQTIDVDNAQLLNEWFETQKAEIYKTRLIDLIIGDYEKYILSKKIQLDGKLTCTGKLKLMASFAKDLPEYYKGIIIVKNEIKYKKNIDKFKSYPNIILSRKETSNAVGECVYESLSPLIFSNAIKDSVTAKMFFYSGFQKEIEKLGIADKFLMTKVIDAQKSWVIAWPLWLFILCSLAVITFIVLIIINTLIPKKLKNYIVKIDNGEPIKMGNKAKYVISTSKSANYQLKTKDDIEIKVYISRADPFCLFVKKRLCFKVKANKPSVTIDNVLQIKKNFYFATLYKEISVSENLSFVKLFFYESEKKKKTKV